MVKQITKCIECAALNLGGVVGLGDNWVRPDTKDAALKRLYAGWVRREESGIAQYSHGLCNNPECVAEAERKADLR